MKKKKYTVQGRFLRAGFLVVTSVAGLTMVAIHSVMEAGAVDASPDALIRNILIAAGVAVSLPGLYVLFVTRRLNAELVSLARSLHQLSDENNQTSENLKASSEALSGSSGEQSAAVQETVASIAEIRSMLAQTANHVREVQNLAFAANDKANDGMQIMNKMEAAMIAVEQTNAQLAGFEEMIRTIREKTQVINDIVFKTQLLSFNASIEAARAGQYGRGFAVVAEEVGKLALMSGVASKEIDQLLSNSMSRVSGMVDSVQTRVRDGKDVTGDALKRFAEIARQIAAISEKITQVGQATMEQEGGVEQTARAMDQMDQAAIHNKKSADDMFKVAERVRSLGARIRQMTADMQSYVREDLDFIESPGASLALAPLEPTPAASPTGPQDSDEDLMKIIRALADKKGQVAAPKASEGDLTADDPSFRKSGTEG